MIKWKASPGWRRESILDVYNLALGIFLFASPWVLTISHGAMADDAWISGFIVVLVATGALVAFAEWQEWITLALGIWILVSPWVLGFQHTSAMKANIAVGALVTYLAAMELWLIHYTHAKGDTHKGVAS